MVQRENRHLAPRFRDKPAGRMPTQTYTLAWVPTVIGQGASPTRTPSRLRTGALRTRDGGYVV